MKIIIIKQCFQSVIIEFIITIFLNQRLKESTSNNLIWNNSVLRDHQSFEMVDFLFQFYVIKFY